jgi:hypothetical protein
VYVDPALFYGRFDVALRPLLSMGAAFLPAVADMVDLSKLPPADVIAKHLSPTVMSQSYQSDGYVAESIGSIPLYHTAISALGATAAFFYQKEKFGFVPSSTTTITMPTPSPRPSPSGSP